MQCFQCKIQLCAFSPSSQEVLMHGRQGAGVGEGQRAVEAGERLLMGKLSRWGPRSSLPPVPATCTPATPTPPVWKSKPSAPRNRSVDVRSAQTSTDRFLQTPSHSPQVRGKRRTINRNVPNNAQPHCRISEGQRAEEEGPGTGWRTLLVAGPLVRFLEHRRRAPNVTAPTRPS